MWGAIVSMCVSEWVVKWGQAKNGLSPQIKLRYTFRWGDFVLFKLGERPQQEKPGTQFSPFQTEINFIYLEVPEVPELLNIRTTHADFSRDVSSLRARKPKFSGEIPSRNPICISHRPPFFRTNKVTKYCSLDARIQFPYVP